VTGTVALFGFAFWVGRGTKQAPKANILRRAYKSNSAMDQTINTGLV
jgi:hypothetical protein